MIDFSTAVVGGKVDRKELAALLHQLAADVGDGAEIAIGVDSGGSHISKNEWLKIIFLPQKSPRQG